MKYYSTYKSILGELIIVVEESKLIGLYIENGKHNIDTNNLIKNDNDKIITKTKTWLDKYFKGLNPDIEEIDIKFIGTDFRIKVWNLLKAIPYGQTMTYGEIAKKINCKSSEAVGGAISHNPISIIVPCHRVLGKNKTLTGFASGINNKKKLLDLENIEYME